MSSSSYNPGPYWTVNSQEMAGGVAILIAIFFIPVYPLAHLGWYIGEDIIGNNFAKWFLGLLMFAVGYIIIMILSDRGKRYSAGFIFLEYLVYDYVNTINTGRDELYMMQILKEIIAWGMSNS